MILLGEQLLGRQCETLLPGHSFTEPFLFAPQTSGHVQQPSPGEHEREAVVCTACLVHFTWVTGEDEHNVPGRKAKSLPRLSWDTTIPTEEL